MSERICTLCGCSGGPMMHELSEHILTSGCVDALKRELAGARATIEAADTTRREWEVRAAKSRKESDTLRGERHDLTNEVMTLKSLLHVALRTTGQLPPGKDLPTDKAARTRLLNTLILDALPALWESRHATGRAAGLREAAGVLAAFYERMWGRRPLERAPHAPSLAEDAVATTYARILALAPPAAEPRDEGES